MSDMVRSPTVFEAAAAAGIANMPADAIKQLAEVYERELQRNAVAAYAAAMAAFQADVGPVPHNRTGNTGSFRWNYSDLLGISHHIRGPAARHGFSWTWTVAVGDPPLIECNILHSGGHLTISRYPIMLWEDGAKMAAPQQWGKGEMYAKTRSLLSGFGLSCGYDDPDASVGVERRESERRATEPRITPAQADSIRRALNDCSADYEAFLAWAGVSEVEDIRAGQYENVMRAIERKRIAGGQ